MYARATWLLGLVSSKLFSLGRCSKNGKTGFGGSRCLDRSSSFGFHVRSRLHVGRVRLPNIFKMAVLLIGAWRRQERRMAGLAWR